MTEEEEETISILCVHQNTRKICFKMADEAFIKPKSFAFYSDLRKFHNKITTNLQLHDDGRLKHAIKFFVANVL